MAVNRLDLIAIEFVIVGVELLNTAQSLGRFGSTLREYRWTPISQAQNGFGDGRRIWLDRERIYLDLTATRSRVRQEYPSEERFRDLAKLVSRTIDLTDEPAERVGPHGYNVEVSYEQGANRSAFSYIGKTIFSGLDSIGDWNLVGGMGAAVRFADTHGVIRNIHIEPRFRNESFQRVYLNLNVHIDSNRIPTTDEISSGLSNSLEDAKRFIQLLEGKA